MPSKLRSFLTSLDVFGEPVSVNFKGETNFKTLPGALLSVLIKSFLLVFAINGTIDLINYEDPQITQYDIFETRRDGDEVNLGEAKANVAFVWYNRITARADEPDPRFINLRIMLAANNDRFETVEDRPAELVKVDNETHSEFFISGNYFD